MDYYTLLNIKPKYKLWFLIITFLIIVFIIYFCNKNIYDTIKIKGIIKNNSIMINMPVKYSDTLINGNFLKIDNKKYDYKINKISSLKIDDQSLLEYQTIEIKIVNNFKDNQILNLSIFYNNEKIINKIKRIIIGKE